MVARCEREHRVVSSSGDFPRPQHCLVTRPDVSVPVPVALSAKPKENINPRLRVGSNLIASCPAACPEFGSSLDCDFMQLN